MLKSESGSTAERSSVSARWCLIAVLATLAFSVGSRSAGPPALDTKGAAAIDAMFQAAVARGEIPGVVAAATNADRILYLKAFGKRDVANHVPMTTDRVFRIASMTKPVT